MRLTEQEEKFYEARLNASRQEQMRLVKSISVLEMAPRPAKLNRHERRKAAAKRKQQ